MFVALLGFLALDRPSPPPPLPPPPVVAMLRRCEHFWATGNDGGYLHQLPPAEQRMELEACLPYVKPYSQPYVELAYTAAWFGVDVRRNSQRIAQSYSGPDHVDLDSSQIDSQLDSLWVHRRRRCVLQALLDIPPDNFPDSDLHGTVNQLLEEHPVDVLSAASGSTQGEDAIAGALASTVDERHGRASTARVMKRIETYTHLHEADAASVARTLKAVLPYAMLVEKEEEVQEYRSQQREDWTVAIPAPTAGKHKLSLAQSAAILCRESMPGDDPDAQNRLDHLIQADPGGVLQNCVARSAAGSSTEVAAAYQLARHGVDLRANVQRLLRSYITGGGGDLRVFIPHTLDDVYQRSHRGFILSDLVLLCGDRNSDAGAAVMDALVVHPRTILQIADSTPITRDELIWACAACPYDDVDKVAAALKRVAASGDTPAAALAKRCAAGMQAPER